VTMGNRNGGQVIPEIFAEQKVMWTIMEFEEKHRGCGHALVKEFFPGELLDWEERWWKSEDIEERRELLRDARRKAWKQAHEKAQAGRQK
jgi:hypothetical protein